MLSIAADRKLNWGRSYWYWGLSAKRAQNLPQQTMGPKWSISEGYKSAPQQGCNAPSLSRTCYKGNGYSTDSGTLDL